MNDQYEQAGITPTSPSEPEDFRPANFGGNDEPTVANPAGPLGVEQPTVVDPVGAPPVDFQAPPGFQQPMAMQGGPGWQGYQGGAQPIQPGQAQFPPAAGAPGQAPYVPGQPPYGQGQAPYFPGQLPQGQGQPSWQGEQPAYMQGAVTGGKSSSKTGLFVVIGLLVLALVGGGIWWALRGLNPGGTVSPTPTLVPSTLPSSSPGVPGPTATAKAEMNAFQAKQWLVGQGFECVQEPVAAFMSSMCMLRPSRGESELQVYVAGPNNGAPTRIALTKAAGKESPKALALRDKLLPLVVGDKGESDAAITAFSAKSDGFAQYTGIGFKAWGTKTGSFLVVKNGWSANTPAKPSLGIVPSQAASIANQLGYTCKVNEVVNSCKKSVGSADWEFAYRTEAGEVTWLRLGVDGATDKAALNTELGRLWLLMGSSGSSYKRAVDSLPRGGVQYVGHVVVDSIPQDVKGHGAVYLYQSCWTDTQRWC